MLLTTVSLVPVVVVLALALGLFGAWIAYLIRADQRRDSAGSASAPTSVPAPGAGGTSRPGADPGGAGGAAAGARGNPRGDYPRAPPRPGPRLVGEGAAETSPRPP